MRKNANSTDRRLIDIVKRKETITLGSLFDGIGGFPYAASFYGIKTLWASEIIPAAMSVTRRHFPDMEHVGDITKLNGGALDPVDIITFGSPCQSFSIAGQRKGLEGKSGLFWEAIRIIKEMRKATNGQWPRYCVFENVPGILSANRGRDYKTVLEAFTEAEIPLPPSGRWTNAGMVRGGRIDVAWVIHDAQHFGVAQRRRRLFAVCDFTGQRAAEILFKPKSLYGYFAQGGAAGKGTAPHAAGGVDSAEQDNINADVMVLNDQGGSSLTIEKSPLSPTLRSETHGNLPIVSMKEAYPINTQIATRHMALGQNTGFGIGKNGDPAYTLQEAHSHAVAASTPETAYGFDLQQITSKTNRTTLKGIQPSLCAAGNPHVIHPQIAGTLCASGAGLSRPAGMASETDLCVVCRRKNGDPANGVTNFTFPFVFESHGQDARYSGPHNISPAVTATYGMGGGNIPITIAGLPQSAGIASETDQFIIAPDTEAIPIQDKATRYTGGGDKRKGDGAGNGLGVGKSGDPAPTITSGDRHAVAAYCLQGNMIGRKDKNGPQGDGVNENIAFTLNTADRHAVAAVDCRNLRETEEISGTLQAKSTGSYSLNYQNPVRNGFVVRRLTPVECERLQGYPDGWTEYGHDGKPLCDTARYQALGNSVAIPCVAYVLSGIADEFYNM